MCIQKKSFLESKEADETLPCFNTLVNTTLVDTTLKTVESIKKDDYLNDSEENIIFAPFSPHFPNYQQNKVAMWPDERCHKTGETSDDSATIVISPPRGKNSSLNLGSPGENDQHDIIKIYKTDTITDNNTPDFVQGMNFF